MGDAIVADPALTLARARSRPWRPTPTARGPEAAAGARGGRADRPDEPVDRDARARGGAARRRRRRARVAVSATLALRNQLRLSRPGSYYFGAGGGLGFGLAAAVGVQLGEPDRPVVCVVGEGSAQYAIQAFWTAAAYDVPVTFLVLRNDEYAILKWFGMMENVTGAPGLDLPALDCVAVASGYGVESSRVAEQRRAARRARARDRARASRRSSRSRVAPGMALA